MHSPIEQYSFMFEPCEGYSLDFSLKTNCFSFFYYLYISTYRHSKCVLKINSMKACL
jgi:hypothetical protein